MPRDSQGGYSLPPGTLVSTGDTVLPSQHNPAMNDIGSALTGSLARSGVGGMLANMPMNGSRVVGMGDGVDPQDAATVAQLNSQGLPIGAPLFWLTSVAPSGFILAFGQAISRTTYAQLFAVIGTTYGIGDGVTTFNVPDCRGVALVGLDNMGGTALGRLNAATTLGAVLGAQSVALTVDQMPTHSHGVTDPGHSHTYQRINSGAAGPGGGNDFSNVNTQTSSSATGITIQNAGSGSAHPNVQPSMALNIIIKTGVLS